MTFKEFADTHDIDYQTYPTGGRYYAVVLSVYQNPPFVFRFEGPEEPGLIDVLECLQGECEAGKLSFHEFCEEFDCQTIKSYAFWAACVHAYFQTAAAMCPMAFRDFMECTSA